MFQRQSRTSFPTRNIIALAAAVLLFLVFLLKQVKEPKPTPADQPILIAPDSIK